MPAQLLIDTVVRATSVSITNLALKLRVIAVRKHLSTWPRSRERVTLCFFFFSLTALFADGEYLCKKCAITGFVFENMSDKTEHRIEIIHLLRRERE